MVLTDHKEPHRKTGWRCFNPHFLRSSGAPFQLHYHNHEYLSIRTSSVLSCNCRVFLEPFLNLRQCVCRGRYTMFFRCCRSSYIVMSYLLSRHRDRLFITAQGSAAYYQMYPWLIQWLHATTFIILIYATMLTVNKQTLGGYYTKLMNKTIQVFISYCLEHYNG